MSEHLHKEDLEELLKILLPELQLLRKEVSQINKAMAYTSKKVTRREEVEQAKQRSRMSVIMKSMENRAS